MGARRFAALARCASVMCAALAAASVASAEQPARANDHPVVNPGAVDLSATVPAHPAVSSVVHFDYGPGPAYGARTPDSRAQPGSRAVAMVTDLAPSRTYHYRLVQQRPDGTMVDGPDRTLQTGTVAGSLREGPALTYTFSFPSPVDLQPAGSSMGPVTLTIQAGESIDGLFRTNARTLITAGQVDQLDCRFDFAVTDVSCGNPGPGVIAKGQPITGTLTVGGSRAESCPAPPGLLDGPLSLEVVGFFYLASPCSRLGGANPVRIPRVPTPPTVASTRPGAAEKREWKRQSEIHKSVAYGFTLIASIGVFNPDPTVSKITALVCGIAAAGLQVRSAQLAAWAADPPDRRFRRLARPARHRPPRVHVGPGISRQAARIANRFLREMFRERAIASAFLTSVERAQGATQAGALGWRTRQLSRAASYARQEATLLEVASRRRRELAQVLAAAGAGTFTTAEARRAQRLIREHGLPAELVVVLRDRLDITAAGLSDLRRGAGRVRLPTPDAVTRLRDSALSRADRAAAGALRAYARTASAR